MESNRVGFVVSCGKCQPKVGLTSNSHRALAHPLLRSGSRRVNGRTGYVAKARPAVAKAEHKIINYI
jgi:hypothetical protein